MKWVFKKHFFLIIFLVSAFNLQAQQNHFIYLQTESKQAFYVKLDKKILSSSASGYLIIPKLQDGTHSFTLGFPKNEWPEQKVTCSIDKKDAGYILKNFGDKGWGLFNWQSMNVVMADKKVEEPPVVVAKQEPPEKKIDDVKEEEPVVPVQEKKVDPVNPIVTVSKLFSNKTAEGIEMIFIDAVNGGLDTVKIFLPLTGKEDLPPVVNKEVPKQQEIKEEKPVMMQPVVAAGNEKNEVIKEEPKKQESKNDEPKIVKPVPVVNEITKENTKQQESVEKAVQPNKPVLQNSDCKAFATEDDFMKLRKKMAAENSDDDMVSAARKIFKTKCFTVSQIQNLSVLFLNDNGRYKFFDAAYPFVTDSYNFGSLQKLLTEEYYINRFKAMMRQ